MTAITDHRTAEAKLYTCCINAQFSNQIVGYASVDRMTAGLADSALRPVITRCQPQDTVLVHSDRGSAQG